MGEEMTGDLKYACRTMLLIGLAIQGVLHFDSMPCSRGMSFLEHILVSAAIGLGAAVLVLGTAYLFDRKVERNFWRYLKMKPALLNKKRMMFGGALIGGGLPLINDFSSFAELSGIFKLVIAALLSAGIGLLFGRGSIPQEEDKA